MIVVFVFCLGYNGIDGVDGGSDGSGFFTQLSNMLASTPKRAENAGSDAGHGSDGGSGANGVDAKGMRINIKGTPTNLSITVNEQETEVGDKIQR
jgi:hypothetical protein